MEIQYFVMLDSQDSQTAMALMDKDGDQIAFFNCELDARLAALENPLGSHFGYEIFERGNGNQ